MRNKSATQEIMDTPCTCGHKRRSHLIHTTYGSPTTAICLSHKCRCASFQTEKQMATPPVNNIPNEYTGHLNSCKCDLCYGACSETKPYCGDCFVCQEKADDDYWWEVNRADCLQI